MKIGTEVSFFFWFRFSRNLSKAFVFLFSGFLADSLGQRPASTVSFCQYALGCRVVNVNGYIMATYNVGPRRQSYQSGECFADAAPAAD